MLKYTGDFVNGQLLVNELNTNNKNNKDCLFTRLTPQYINKYFNQVCHEVITNSEALKKYELENCYRNYLGEIISFMTNSDITEIILDKKREVKVYPTDENERIIKRLEFELRQRNPDTRSEFTKEMLDMKKREISIVEVIKTISGKSLEKGTRGNIQCLLPDHNDKTSSMHIYEHSNSWKCFGCHRGGSQVDFIMEYNKVSLAEAIKLFLTF